MNNIDECASNVNTLESLEDFKWWRLQNALPAQLAKEIIFRWRGSNAKVSGDPVPWTAYPHRRWMQWMGMPMSQKSTYERALKNLVDNGLVERERHRFGGTTTCSFLRPTETALRHLGRAEDLARMAAQKAASKPLKTKPFGATLDGTGDGTLDGTGDGSDYTSFPSLSTYSSYSPEKEPVLLTGKGKGKDGEEKKEKVTATHIPKEKQIDAEPVVVAKLPPIDPDDLEFSAQWEKLQAVKAKKQAKLFPELKGTHEKDVKHPSKQFPAWSSYSDQIKANIYLKYESYVANWYKGKKGQPYADSSISDEEWAAVSAMASAWVEEDA